MSGNPLLEPRAGPFEPAAGIGAGSYLESVTFVHKLNGLLNHMEYTARDHSIVEASTDHLRESAEAAGCCPICRVCQTVLEASPPWDPNQLKKDGKPQVLA